MPAAASPGEVKASMDYARGSAPPRRGQPNRTTPVQCICSRFWAASPGNGHTSKCSPLRFLFWENRSDPGSVPAGRERPSRGQIFQALQTKCRSRRLLQRGELAADQLVGFCPVEILNPLNRIAEFRQYSILHHASRKRYRVRNSMKGDHRIFRDEELRVLCFQGQLDFFTKKKSRIRHAISHLDEIFDRHVGNRICVDSSGLLKLFETELPIRPVAIEYLKKTSAVFETAIQSLAEEGDDRVSRVS